MATLNNHRKRAKTPVTTASANQEAVEVVADPGSGSGSICSPVVLVEVSPGFQNSDLVRVVALVTADPGSGPS